VKSEVLITIFLPFEIGCKGTAYFLSYQRINPKESPICRFFDLSKAGNSGEMAIFLKKVSLFHVKLVILPPETEESKKNKH